MDEMDNNKLRQYKEFGPTSFAVGHSTSILVLFVIIAIAGVISYRTIPKESFPEIEIPMIVVNTVYPGVSPADVETLVTRPLEEELSTISELEELTSSSVEGYSSITAEFSTTVDLNEALQKVREKVDLAKPELPDDAEDPSIVEINFSEIPVMQVNLSGEYGLVRLKEIGEDLQDELEQIVSVLRVDLRGGLEREVKVDVDLNKLKYYNLSFDDVVEAIQNENLNIPGGSIDVGDRSYLVRVDGEFTDPSVIEDLVVVTVGEGQPIYVRDVATVDFGFADRESFARLDENPVVTLDVVKRSGQNIIETAEAVKAVIAEMEPSFPPTTVVKITSDSSEDIFEMVSSLENNIISGLILIVGVLLFFLGVRTSMFVAISIPMSMFLSFIVMGALGVSMNMVVLFSLILALGMLVDNAIVIVENIYRYLEEGWDRVTAAKKATGEVAVPVIAATLTTLGAFAPLMFWPGQTGEFMKYLPLTLIITLSSSLFVALIIVPTLCALLMRVETKDSVNQQERFKLPMAGRVVLLSVGLLTFLVIASANPITAVLVLATIVLVLVIHKFILAGMAAWFQAKGLPAVVHRYEIILRWSLANRWVYMVLSPAIFLASVFAFGALNSGVEFFPEDIPPAQILVDIETPVGSRVEFTDELAAAVSSELDSFEGFEDTESVVETVGGSSGGGGAFGGGGPSGSNSGRITLSLTDYQDRSRDAFATLADLQDRLGGDLAGAEITVDKQDDGTGTGPPVNIEISGEDPAVIQQLSDEALAILRGSPVFTKLVGLESSLDAARPELSVIIDREKASLYGLSTRKVGMAVRGAIQGIEAAKYRSGNDEYDIVVRVAEQYRDDLNALESLTAVTEGGIQVPLSSVARWEVQDGYGSINRKDMDRVAVVSSDVRAGLNANAVLAEVRETLDSFVADLPPGYVASYTGQQEDQAEAQAFLVTAFMIALALIGMILVSQFNSVVKPVIILSSVIMSTVGVLWGLIVFQMPFVIIMTGVGIISLAGIVVNNAIVLIDYIDILRERDGMDRREALVQGGKTRFRPVVLTAITTALGLVPLAIGLNFNFFGLYGSLNPEFYWGGEQASWWAPMAIAVIGGLISSTVLTLIVIPCVYYYMERLRGGKV